MKILYVRKPENKIHYIYRNFMFNSKDIVYIIKCTKCNEIYIGYTQTLNNHISFDKSNIKLSENWKLYECKKGNFKSMRIDQNTDNSLLQKKKKAENYIDRFKLT